MLANSALTPHTYTILVVDDDGPIRRLMRMQLEREGYAVVEALSGEQALTEFERHAPALVLLDLMLGGMDGFETCQRLIDLPNGNITPVVVLTAAYDLKSVEHAFASGAIDFVRKPIQWMELSQRMKRLIQRKCAEEVLRDRKAHLEGLIEQRTAELTATNQALQQEVQVRRLMEDALKERIDFENLITMISTHFINIHPQKVDESINEALSMIGLFTQVARTSIYLVAENRSAMCLTYEWRAKGSAPWSAAQHTMPFKAFPWLIGKLARFEDVIIANVEQLSPQARAEAAFFGASGSQTIIAIPLVYNNVFSGFLSLDSGPAEKVWPEDSVPLLRMITAIFANTLEHRRTGQALHDREQQLREITDAMLDVVVKTTPEGIIDFASPSCWAVLSHTPESLIGQPFFANVHPEDAEAMQAHIQADGVAEYRYIREDGSCIWLEALSNLLLAEDGTLRGMVFAIRDITQRKHAEHELHTLNRLKTDFLSTAAHELRTPLTSIRGFSEILIMRELEPARAARYLRMINTQAEQLGKIIDDLLDISRLEAKGNLTLEKEVVELLNIIEDAVAMFAENAPRHQFRVEADSACALVSADPLRIGQVMKNLISNAVKYSPQGGVIVLALTCLADTLQVEIRDQGIGLTPEQQQHIFEKFYRADASNIAISGTGLGLSISKLIVDLHGGRMWLESTWQAGTSFYFTLPLNAQATGEPSF